MHRPILDEDPAPHPARTARPAGMHALLFLSAAVPWLGLAALWACTAPPLLGEGAVTRVTVGTALGAAALLLSAVLALRAHWRLSSRLAALRASARELTEHGLPHAASLMAGGQPLDTFEIVPELQFGNDELGRTAQEIAAAQRAALALAVRQSDSRENVRRIFLNLARRTQSLIHHQVAMLDAMERSHEDPDLLQELFAIDHLSTRLRRHAENLVILGGALPPRQWRHGVPLMDVVRSAVSETEEYARVEVENLPRATVFGRAVADIVHLLAELLENGCSFSPPHTQVTVTGEEVSRGLVLEIEDRGPGMPDEQYQQINTLLANASSFDSAPTGEDGRLGMFVVGRLAHRHGATVELRRSPYGGTRVIVLLPKGLVDADVAGNTTHAPTAPQGTITATAADANADPAAEANADLPAAPAAPEKAAAPTAPEKAADRAPAAVPAQDSNRQGNRPVLPKRVKRASLAAELRESAAAQQALGSRRAATRSPAASTPAPSAEASRATMAAIQRATRLARDSEPHETRGDTRDINSGGADSPAPALEDQPR
jgi:signal transduction histidine kinase